MTPPPRPEHGACPDENVLASFATGALPATVVPKVEAHLDGCADCRELVGAVAAESSVPDTRCADAPTRLDTGVPTLTEAGTEPVLPEGTRLGPYVLRELLGAGGMGVVYAAEDPKLGRRVALKLLRPLRDGAEGEGRERLLREAQAMARLSHPNVLPVFELGTADGRDFLAMEWVEGTTLGGWLRARERPWREVLELFLAAGAGLAAAHRAGLVHRDFKPANVLVGLDGRPRVTDFGLARHGMSDRALAATPAVSNEPALTRAGAVAGTPAYMSPEQRAGRPVDARSDQYSFCVALHEALHGERPSGPEGRARGATVTSSRIPKHVRAALARGLAAAPEDRFPSMDGLLAALSRPRRSPFPAVSLRLAVALLLLGTGLVVSLWRQVAPEPPVTAPRVSTEAPGKEAPGNQLIELRVAEVREVRVPQLERIAVGALGVVEVHAGSEGMRLTALAHGTTHLVAWSRNGERRLYTVSVTSL
ncbi:protein kinase domain-containing protein [Pyxidicoccus trucidator]|uniref:protein kinase domain-containing protein n=1 Tax=Pyxidicoccus trucidator TaxID=2709662 RepID=UPI0013DBB3D5|nr:protein kinase [Pyxidicoccus trucidator]